MKSWITNEEINITSSLSKMSGAELACAMPWREKVG